ncbi:MAG: RNA 3'-terminal phosphate cyclase [Candidatus Aenigmarchaeota archaeon]|nr:RNA 3'-terminal phosphate cyclase [Candidatus Aenigmarchaeota archaeon]
MIEIDGSYGEGGGQIIRTALALSALTEQACRIKNIRKGRPNPGLQNQHLAAVSAMQEICNAEVSGNKLGSTELIFSPKDLRFGAVDISIPTAGSVGLVLQPIMIAASHAKNDINIKIDGGATHGKWAPPISYIKEVLLNHLTKFGYKASIEIERYGYYPRGGAKLEMVIQPCKLGKINLTESGKVKEIFGYSHASLHLKEKKVAERQAMEAATILNKIFGTKISIDANYYDTLNPGSGIEIFARMEKTILGSDALGEIKKSADEVGTEAAEKLVEQINNNGAVDEYAEDQLLPYMALTGGEIKVGKLTEHAKTNMWVIEKFLPVKFEVDEESKIIRCNK